MNHISFDGLTPRTVYRLSARNLKFGVWTGNTFIGIREKFGDRMLDSCEIPGATAFAVEAVGAIPDGIPLTESLGTICSTCSREVHWEGPPSPAPWVHDDSGTEINGVPRSIPNRELFAALDEYESADAPSERR